MEKTEDGYWRVRWQVPKRGENGQVLYAVRKVTRDRESRTKVYKKLTLYLHHLAVYLGNPISLSRAEEGQGKLSWEMSHLCGNPSCYNPAHLVHEPHAINLDRIGCFTEGCVHFPKCQVSKKQREEKTRKLYEEHKILRE
jgi:hypothetical protein